MLVMSSRGLREEKVHFLLGERKSFRVLRTTGKGSTLNVLTSGRMSVLFSSMGVPCVGKLRLAGTMERSRPRVRVIVFDKCGSFSCTERTLQCNIISCILGPISPGRFRGAFRQIVRGVSSGRRGRGRRGEGRSCLGGCFFLECLCSKGRRSFIRLRGLASRARSSISRFSHVILIDTSGNFFRARRRRFLADLGRRIRERFCCIGLGSGRSVFLFTRGCASCRIIMRGVCQFFTRRFSDRYCFTIDRRVRSEGGLTRRFGTLRKVLRRRFCRPRRRLFFRKRGRRRGGTSPTRSSRVVRRVAGSVRCGSLPRLHRSFRGLRSGCHTGGRFSSVCMGFMFSKVLGRLLSRVSKVSRGVLSGEISQLCHYGGLGSIVTVMSRTLRRCRRYVRRRRSKFHSRVAGMGDCVCRRCRREGLKTRALSTVMFLSPKCLDTIFGRRAKIALGHFVHRIQVRGTGRLLRAAGVGVSKVTGRMKFSGGSCFYEDFQRFFKSAPRTYEGKARTSRGAGARATLSV